MSTVSGSRRRYLALWLPFLSIERIRRKANRHSAAPDERPLVLVEKENNALRIVSADRCALRLGLHAGLALADARARVAELLVYETDEAADLALLNRMADWCDRYTPLVALDQPDGLILDITGCAHLFGGEEMLRDRICNSLTAFGFDAWGAIACTPEAARALSRFGNREIVPLGHEAGATYPLPVAALGISSEIVSGLSRAGLKTIGDLAGRPKTPLAARFGEALIAKLQRVLGFEDIRITPHRPLPDCIFDRDFAEPITQLETVRAALGRLIQKASNILEARGQGGRHFEITLFRADGAVKRIAVETAKPTRDVVILQGLFHERMEALSDALDPGFGFDLLRFAVSTTEAFEQTQRMLDGHENDDESISALTDRLAARLGRGHVRQFAPGNSHIPELAARTMPAAEAESRSKEWEPLVKGEPPARPLHLFDPPQLIEAVAEVPDGPPLRFRWRRVLHDVAMAEGPERIAPEWWRRGDDTLTRDYYRIEDARGQRFWVFREGLYGRETLTPRWFMHGLFA